MPRTQCTLSLYAAIEQPPGVSLCERVGKTMALTDTGSDLLEHARAIAVRLLPPGGCKRQNRKRALPSR